MLDFPGVVDPQAIGQFHLVQRILEQFELVAFSPGPRQLVLIEDAELHRLSFSSARVAIN